MIVSLTFSTVFHSCARHNSFIYSLSTSCFIIFWYVRVKICCVELCHRSCHGRSVWIGCWRTDAFQRGPRGEDVSHWWRVIIAEEKEQSVLPKVCQEESRVGQCVASGYADHLQVWPHPGGLAECHAGSRPSLVGILRSAYHSLPHSWSQGHEDQPHIGFWLLPQAFNEIAVQAQCR